MLPLIFVIKFKKSKKKLLSIYLDFNCMTFSRACFEKVNHLADNAQRRNFVDKYLFPNLLCSLHLTLQAINESLTCCRFPDREMGVGGGVRFLTLNHTSQGCRSRGGGGVKHGYPRFWQIS